ncbi:MAG: hypothetical protein Q7V63_08625 [Gammaproteobacteria bacterium]|nr:hypothetical protein [Gammaproteobacteria bacterium]
MVKLTQILKAAAFSGLWLMAHSSMAMQSYGPTKPNETLWTIASHHHPAKISIDQAALAIVKLNPKAFKGADYVLRARSYLKLPTTATEVRTALNLPVLRASHDKPKYLAKPIPKKLQVAKSHHVKRAPVNHVYQASSAPVSIEIAQLTKQLAAANQQTASLQQQLDNANTGFPWASLWFILWGLTVVSMYMLHRHYKANALFEEQDDPISPRQKSTEKTEPIIISVSEKPIKNPFEQCELDIPSSDTVVLTKVVASKAAEVTEDVSEAIPATPEIEALLQEIETDPYNLELRMQVLECYINQGDRAGFDQQSRDMVTHNVMMEGDELWIKLRALYLDTWVYS